jgi:hypothetical protein
VNALHFLSLLAITTAIMSDIKKDDTIGCCVIFFFCCTLGGDYKVITSGISFGNTTAIVNGWLPAKKYFIVDLYFILKAGWYKKSNKK